MIKNRAGQHVSANLISKTDGTDVISGVTAVYVTKDGGAQSPGSGTVEHEGNGEWSYPPTQAETNADHVAFTFKNPSAVTKTINVYPKVSEAGIGADEVTITWTNTTTGLPVSDGDVWITSDSAGNNVVAGTLQTNSSGQVTFLLDAGSTYYFWAQKDGVNSVNGQSFVAVAD
jgi:hypothetical protein